jgi:hypothetical protein
MRTLSVLLCLVCSGCLSSSESVTPDGGTGGSSPAASSGGSGQQTLSCNSAGATQSCCGTGTQTCSGSAEFLTWGPCVDPSGQTLSCCMPGEFTTCDAGAPPLPPLPALCLAGGVNNEPEILVGYAPASGEVVGANGQIKVWINDEGAPIIAPGEQLDPATGQITTPGDRAAKAPDGYLWEPALYIAPQSAENGGTPHFPSLIKGSYNNTTKKGAGALILGMDPPPVGTMLPETYTAEDIWDVNALGLGPGTYIGEFVIHDGDHDRGVGCVTIVIDPLK